MPIPSAVTQKRTEDHLRELQEAVKNVPAILRGRAHEPFELAASGTHVIAHGLGRAWQGWFVVDANGPPGYLYAPDTQPNPDRFIHLAVHPSAPTTVRYKVWVF